MTARTSLCSTTTTAEIQEIAPDLHGWRQYEHTGRASTSCTCGLNTGLVPATDAQRIACQHRGGHTS